MRSGRHSSLGEGIAAFPEQEQDQNPKTARSEQDGRQVDLYFVKQSGLKALLRARRGQKRHLLSSRADEPMQWIGSGRQLVNVRTRPYLHTRRRLVRKDDDA